MKGEWKFEADDRTDGYPLPEFTRILRAEVRDLDNGRTWPLLIVPVPEPNTIIDARPSCYFRGGRITLAPPPFFPHEVIVVGDLAEWPDRR